MKIRPLFVPLAAFWLCICTKIYAYGAYATTPKADLGDIASNIVEVELVANSFIQFVFVTSGLGLIASSIYHFKLWSQNRQHRPFSRPLLFLIFGLALIGLVYIPMPISK